MKKIVLIGFVSLLGTMAYSQLTNNPNLEFSEFKISIEEDELILSIEDNGRGLPPNFKYTGGIGIDIMHHRAELCASRLLISSSDSTGTCISCRVKMTECLDMDEARTTDRPPQASAALTSSVQNENRSYPPANS